MTDSSKAGCSGLAATLNHSAQRMSTGAGPPAGMPLVEPFPAGYMRLMTCHPKVITCWLAHRYRVCRAGLVESQTRQDRLQLGLGWEVVGGCKGSDCAWVCR